VAVVNACRRFELKLVESIGTRDHVLEHLPTIRCVSAAFFFLSLTGWELP
jgi:hypothetical protein